MVDRDRDPTAYEEFKWEYEQEKLFVDSERFAMTLLFLIAPHRLSMKQYKEAVYVFSGVILSIFMAQYYNAIFSLSGLFIFATEHFFLKKNISLYNRDIERRLKTKWGIE